MRQEVVALAASIADELLEGLDYMSVAEVSDEQDIVLTDDEHKWVFNTVTSARTTLDTVVSGKIERLQNVVFKLANNTGWDISELVEEGFLDEDDLG